jgi:beta-lactam-binding protein with PASTA domain
MRHRKAKKNKMKDILIKILKSALVKNLLLAGAILLVLVYGLLFWLRQSTHHGEKLPVPDLSKKTLSEVEKILDAQGMRYVVMDSANYNPDYPRFSVIDQTPKPGDFVKENRKIYLTINPSDFNDVTIPNIIQKTYRQAEPTLISLGFLIGDTVYRPNIARDVVLEIKFRNRKVNPGEKLKKNSTLDLILGDGKTNF